MFKLIRKILTVLFVMIMISEAIPVLAYSSPDKLKLSTDEITAFVGEEFTVKSKGKGRIKAVFTPKDSDAGIILKKNKGNKSIVKIKKINKYFYKIETLKKGNVSIRVVSKRNKKLQKSFKLTVKDKNTSKENNVNSKKQEIELKDFNLSQGILDWSKPNHPKGKTLSLSTKNMKIYAKLIANDGKVFDSSTEEGFEFKSSDEKIFTMDGNTIIPVEKGKATLKVEFIYNGKVHSFDLVDINIGDYYPIPTAILLNQYSTVVTSTGTNNQVKIKAVIDQYGNEIDVDDAEWNFDCFEHEINPTASKFGNIINIEGNEAFPTIYRMKVSADIYGGTATAVFDIIVRP